VRILLGTVQAAKGDSKSAAGQFEAVARNPKSRWADLARTQRKTLRDSKPLPRPGQIAPEVRLAVRLPSLSQPPVDRASLDDPTADISVATSLASAPPERKAPAPFLRVTLPDPFEHHHPLRLRIAPAEEPLPADAPPAPARP
jgi:hypothetical protein